ncbi:MAG: hypothetical protein WAN16_07430, partial [Chthoniobacterales bacterium]
MFQQASFSGPHPACTTCLERLIALMKNGFFTPKIALEGGVLRILSGKQEWRELGRRVGIEYRRNHEAHEKHEMKDVIGLQFLFSHPSA